MEVCYYPSSVMERVMKVQEVILRAIDGRLKWYQAAEILGISDRQMRRWKLYLILYQDAKWRKNRPLIFQARNKENPILKLFFTGT